METIIFTHEIQSDTLVLPELRSLIGKTVEITIRDLPSSPPLPNDRWQPLMDAAGKDLIDPDVYIQHREFDKHQYGAS